MLEGGSGDAEVVLVPVFETFQDKAAVGLGLDEGRVVFDVLDEPVDVPLSERGRAAAAKQTRQWLSYIPTKNYG